MKKIIMSVDDSIVIRAIIKKTLQDQYEILEAEDGPEALEKMKGKEISLILCDVNMPRMSGLNFVEEFRKDPQFESVPVIMLTAESGSRAKQHAKKIGAKGWMSKPFTNECLLQTVAKLAH